MNFSKKKDFLLFHFEIKNSLFFLTFFTFCKIILEKLLNVTSKKVLDDIKNFQFIK